MADKSAQFALRHAGGNAVSPQAVWHCIDCGEVARALGTDPVQGLAAEAAAQRLVRYGRNELRESRRRPPWRILLDQFADFMIVVLIAAAVVSGVIGEPQDTIAIIAILVLNAVIGFVQEYRAERAMAALKRIAAPSASVLRAGRRITLPAHELVCNDRNDDILRGFAALGHPVGREQFAFRTDDLMAYWQAVRAGLGIGFVAHYMARTDPEVLPVLPQLAVPPLPIWLTVHREIRSCARIRAVYDFLAEAVPQAL